MTFVAGLAFWTALTALAYTFVGYRVLMRLLVRRRAAATESGRSPAGAPQICAVVVAHNEENRIAARVQNLLAAEYPPDRLRVLVVSDGSTDGTVKKVEELGDPRVSVLALPESRGKAAGLNAAVQSVTAELVIFTDARQQFAPDAISRLAADFADARTGAVSGSLDIHGAQSNTGRGIDAYWRFEKAIRTDESRWDSCIGCTGAIYAIRGALFEPIPEDTVLDDVVIPMQIAMKGFRVRHEESALAFDPQPLEPAAERLRKQRTLAGNFQMLFRYPEWLIPGRSRLWWQLLSHKYLRLTSPLWMAVALAANLALLGIPFYRVTFAAQAAMYGCALAGILFPGLKGRAFALPAGFLFLNLAVTGAFLRYLCRADLHRWQGLQGERKEA